MLRSLLLIISFINSPLSLAGNTDRSILVVGDSISAAYGIDQTTGWVHLLESKLTQKKKPYQVINASISADTTINGLKRLPALLKQYRPAVTIIELGGNDGLRGLSLKSMKKNLATMIKLCLQADSKVILAGMRIPPNYGKRYTQGFYQIYQDLNKNHEITLIPFILQGIGDKKELMQKDGLHPTEQAQKVILHTVWKKLKQVL